MSTKIVGKTKATSKQMKKYIKSVNPNVPQSVIDMIPLYLSEGKAEGIRGDIAFAQSCIETGNFTFKGSAVTLSQNNFAGIGVTQNGMKGNSWATSQLGIRAQIQHLKAYATKEKLKNKCIDPRYEYVEKGCAPYVEWLGIQENPKRKGWAAGKNYGGKILSVLNKILSIKTTDNKEKSKMNVKINKKLIKTNQTSLKRSKSDIKYIVVHYVGALGGALDNVNFYAGGNRNASADFFVGHSGEIYQAVDYYNAYSWHCGGGLQGAGGASHYGKCTNKNSVGIEMCVKKRSTVTMNASDKDWYFTDQTYQSTVQLVKYLMEELNIDSAHVIRHYDVNGKICPNPFVYNTGSHTWSKFKSDIKSGSSNKSAAISAGGMFMFKVPIVKKGEVGNHVLLVQEILRARGFKGKDGKALQLDRKCDANTVYAIKQYQKDREKNQPGICGGVDGIAGEKTLRDMIAL